MRGWQPTSPDWTGDGRVLRCDALAYGLTPRSMLAARRTLAWAAGRGGASRVAFDVGARMVVPPCPSLQALLDGLRSAIERGVAVVAMPDGSPSACGMEFCLACVAMTIDQGASLPSALDPGREDAWSFADAAWYQDGPVTAPEALGLGIADVLVTPAARMEAAEALAGGPSADVPGPRGADPVMLVVAAAARRRRHA